MEEETTGSKLAGMQNELEQLEKEVQRFEDRQEKENKVRMALLDRSHGDCRSAAWSFDQSVGRSVVSFVVSRSFGYVTCQSFVDYSFAPVRFVGRAVLCSLTTIVNLIGSTFSCISAVSCTW